MKKVPKLNIPTDVSASSRSINRVLNLQLKAWLDFKSQGGPFNTPVLNLSPFLIIYKPRVYGDSPKGSGFVVKSFGRRLFRFRRGIKPNFLWGNP